MKTRLTALLLVLTTFGFARPSNASSAALVISDAQMAGEINFATSLIIDRRSYDKIIRVTPGTLKRLQKHLHQDPDAYQAFVQDGIQFLNAHRKFISPPDPNDPVPDWIQTMFSERIFKRDAEDFLAPLFPLRSVIVDDIGDLYLNQRLSELLRDYTTVDIFIFEHTMNSHLILQLIDPKDAQRIRLVYDSQCDGIGSGEELEWLARGVKSYIGHQGTSCSPAFNIPFLKCFLGHEGNTARACLEQANRFESLFAKIALSVCQVALKFELPKDDADEAKRKKLIENTQAKMFPLDDKIDFTKWDTNP